MEYEFLMMVGVLIIVAALNNYFPIKGRNNILFGAIIEEELKYKEPFSKMIKQYKILNLLTCILGVIINVVGILISSVFIQSLGLIIYIIINTIIYIILNKKVRERKKDFSVNKKRVSVANIEVTKISAYRILYYLVLSVFFIGINVIVAILKYKDLPSTIATHFNMSGVADGWSAKSPLTVSMLIITTIIMIVIFIGSDLLIQKISYRIDPKNPEESHKANIKTKKLLNVMMFITMIPVLVSLTIGNFVTFKVIPESYMKSVILIPIISLIGVIGLTVGVIKSRNNYKVKNNDVTYKDDDNCWKGGLIYYNKNNPNTFVEKRSGVGITINAGTKLGMGIYIATIIILLISVVVPMIGAALK